MKESYRWMLGFAFVAYLIAVVAPVFASITTTSTVSCNNSTGLCTTSTFSYSGSTICITNGSCTTITFTCGVNISCIVNQTVPEFASPAVSVGAFAAIVLVLLLLVARRRMSKGPFPSAGGKVASGGNVGR